MPTDWAIRRTRRMALKMVYLEKAAQEALNRQDREEARRLWRQRERYATIRSGILREDPRAGY